MSKYDDAIEITWSVAQARSMIDATPDSLFQPAHDEFENAIDNAQGNAQIKAASQYIIIEVKP